MIRNPTGIAFGVIAKQSNLLDRLENLRMQFDLHSTLSKKLRHFPALCRVPKVPCGEHTEDPYRNTSDPTIITEQVARRCLDLGFDGWTRMLPKKSGEM